MLHIHNENFIFVVLKILDKNSRIIPREYYSTKYGIYLFFKKNNRFLNQIMALPLVIWAFLKLINLFEVYI